MARGNYAKLKIGSSINNSARFSIMKWEREDYELLGWIIIIVLMVAFIPTLVMYDWLQYAANWQRTLNFINWLLNEVLKWLSAAV